MLIETIKPRNDAHWHKLRGQDVTASTVGALFGVHPYETLFGLWARKSGLMRPDAGLDNAAMMRGRYLEPVAVQILRDRHPDWTITHNAAENVYYRDPENRVGATPDVIAECPKRGRGIVQIKSVEAGAFRRSWTTEDGDVEVPLWIALQATVEAKLTGAVWAAVAPLVVSHGLDMPECEIELIDGVYGEICRRTADFWDAVANERRPDIDPIRDAETIDDVYRRGFDDVEVDLTGDPDILELIAERQAAAAARSAAEARVTAAETRIKSALGPATLAYLPGGRRATWRPQRSAYGVRRVLRLPQMEQ